MAMTYSFLQAYASSSTFVAPKSGWYRVYVYGKCGNGGSGGMAFSASSLTYPRGGSGGGSGGTGGVAISDLHLEQGQTFPIAFATNMISFGTNVSGIYLTSTNGGDGGDASPAFNNGFSSYSYPGDGGTAGTATGGNLVNLNGYAGAAGGKGRDNSNSNSQYDAQAGNAGLNNGMTGGASSPSVKWVGAGGGGAGGSRFPSTSNPELNKYTPTTLSNFAGGDATTGTYYNNRSYVYPGNPPDAYPALNLGAPMLYGGGGGGGGGGAIKESDPTYVHYSGGGAGGVGSPGLIIIEQADNTAPAPPTNIAYSGNTPGQPVTVSWGAATDADGDAISYVLERRTEENAWEAMGVTTDTYYHTTVPLSGINYSFRVKARDEHNAESTYSIGSAVPIIYNVAPTTPAGLSYSESKAGKPQAISWLPSSDADGDTITYVVEQSANSGAYQVIGSTGATTLSAPVPSDGEYYNIRVKATDAHGNASDYCTGANITLVYNSAPYPPAVFTYFGYLPNTQMTVEWDAAIDDDGDAVTYVLERRVDGGEYEPLLATGETSMTTIVPPTLTYQIRIKAVDVHGADSEYVEGPVIEIADNTPPSVSGADIDIGEHTQPFTYNYTLHDPDLNEVLTVTESLETAFGTLLLRTFAAQPGENCTADVSGKWMNCAAGANVLVITVQDSRGERVTRRVSFTRKVERIAARRIIQTGERVSKVFVDMAAGLTGDCRVEVSNNPYDDTPVWENVTSKLGRYVHVFANQSVQNSTGLGIRVRMNPTNEEPTVELELLFVRYA